MFDGREAYLQLNGPFQGTSTAWNDRGEFQEAGLYVEFTDQPSVDDDYVAPANNSLSVPAPGVLSNDLHAAVRPSVQLVAGPTHGTLQLRADGSFSYVPTAGYQGLDTFQYRTVDGSVIGNVAQVTLGVGRPTVYRHEPIIKQNSSLVIDSGGGLIGNAVDYEGDTLSASVVTAPTHGTLTLNPNGTFVYVPTTNYSGRDWFTYRANDGHSNSNVAIVGIIIEPILVDVALRAVAAPSASNTTTTLPSSIAAAGVGTQYYLELWVQDTGNPSAGLIGGRLDLLYTTTRADATSVSHGGVFTQVPSGVINDVAGLVDDFGGGTLNANVGVPPNWVRLGYVAINATAAGNTVYSLAPGNLLFSRFGAGANVPWDMVDLNDIVTVIHGVGARVETRLVASPTSVDAAGEVTNLPSNLVWIDEWDSFWVELWISTPTVATGVSAGRIDLSYNTSYFTAMQIEYGPAFTGNQTGTINDATGLIDNIGASTSRTDVGDDRFGLLARVRFAPSASDQVPVNEVTHASGPYNLGLNLSDPAFSLVGGGAAGTELGNTVTTQVWSVPYDIDDNDLIDFGDFSYFVAAFAQPVGGGEPPYTWWADFNRTGGAVDFADFSLFAANFGREKPDANVVFPGNFPQASPGASLPTTAGGPEPDGGAGGGGTPLVDVELIVLAAPSATDQLGILPATLKTAAVGETYYLEIWVQDVGLPGLGIVGGQLDIAYTTQRADVGEIQHGDLFTTFPSDTADDTGGVIDELGGGTFSVDTSVAPQWARLAYAPITITSPGSVVFQATPGRLQFSRASAGNVAWGDVDFSEVTLNGTDVPGDTNNDRAVNVVDLNNVRNNFGLIGPDVLGDTNGDEQVDIEDLNAVRNNFGVSVSGSPSLRRRTLAPLEDREASEPSYALMSRPIKQRNEALDALFGLFNEQASQDSRKRGVRRIGRR